MFEIIGIGIVSLAVLWIALSWDNDYDTMKDRMDEDDR